MCRVGCTTDIPNISNGLFPTSQPQINPRLPPPPCFPFSVSSSNSLILTSIPFFCLSLSVFSPNSLSLSALCPVSPHHPRPHSSVSGRKVKWVCGSPGEQQRLCLEESWCTPPYFYFFFRWRGMIRVVGGIEGEKLLKTTVFVFLSSQKDTLCLGPSSSA